MLNLFAQNPQVELASVSLNLSTTNTIPEVRYSLLHKLITLSILVNLY